jgi:hypothetical protein
MGRGKPWSDEEIIQVTRAYIYATHTIKGVNQTTDSYINSMLIYLKANIKGPIEEGTFWQRGHAIWFYFRDTICPNIQKFNKSLQIIDAANLTRNLTQ